MSRPPTNYYSGTGPPLTHQHQMPTGPTGHFNQFQMPGQQPNENNWNAPSAMNWQQQHQPPASVINTSITQHMPNMQQIPVQQFSATNVFDNTKTNTDGWGDWGDGDWNDNSQNQQQRNYGANQFNNVLPPPPQTLYGQPTHYQPQLQQPFQSQQNNDQLHSQHGSQPSANIAESFGDNTNWNWNASESGASGNNEPLFQTVGKDAVAKHSKDTSNASDTTPATEKMENNLSRPPDNNKNTQLNNPAMNRIMKGERLLTPQWSTESQMSHTSSDRSIDSDAMNSRSTTSSDDPSNHQQHYGYHETNQQSMSNFGVENVHSHQSYNVHEEPKSVDKLDEVLFALNANHNVTNNSTNTYQNPTDVMQPPPPNSQQITENEWTAIQSFQMSTPPTPVNNYQNETMASQQPLGQQPLRPPSVSSLPPPPAFQEFSRITPSPMNHPPPSTSTPMNLPPPPTIQQLARKNSSPLNQPQMQPTPPPMNQPQINNAFSSEYTGMLPPPPLQQPQRKNSSPQNQTLSQLPATTSGLDNPFKRTGAHVHNKNIFHSDTMTMQSIATMPAQFNQFAPNEFNQQHPPPDNSEVIEQNVNRNFISHENHELAPNNDRNQYLQTGHLSEEAFTPAESQSTNYEQNDNLPPPGLSRLVLGQPEIENHQTHPTEPPPGLARMVPGTELTNSTPLNLDRQADGQDTMSHVPSTRPSNVSNYPMQQQQQQHHSNIPVNILDRNLYLVPGESDIHTQRVVTGGLEREQSRSAQDVSVIPLADEERELVMDGENLEDDNQISRDDPIEGANTGDETQTATNVVENEQIVSPIDSNKKFNSNPSTCNDDSDKERSTYYRTQTRRGDEISGHRRRKDKNAERYETEDTDYSDRDRGRLNREGSVRNDRPRRSKDKDEWPKENRERYRDDRERNRKEGDRYRGDKSRQDRYARYETDGSRYETEDSRYERYRREDREPRDRREESDRRYRKGDRSDRVDRGDRSDRGDRINRVDRQNESRSNRYRTDKETSDRKRDKTRPSDSYYEYDDDHYRRTGSRNALDRDREKDPRYAAPNYYQQGYGYDQYSYYQQQQYYETLRRTNPQAYAEWYKMYYSQMQQAQMTGNNVTTATDGRESVHSGRSSANEKERYSRSSNHQQMYYDPNIYQGQFSQQQNSTMLDNSYIAHRERQSLSRQHSLTKSYNIYSDSTRLDASESVQLSHQRSTPCKFTVDHSVASLSNGVMVCVKPQFSTNEFSKIVKVFNMGVNDSTRKLYQIYPGPLIRGTTHKKTIIEFCEDQIRLGPSLSALKSKSNSMSSLYSSGLANKSSYTLMWNLLILLLRQNGMVIGTDISELLLKNKSEFPYESVTKSSMSSLHSRRNSNDSEKVRYNQDVSDGSNDVDNSEGKKPLSEIEITEKFRNYLLYGNVNEALEWATDNNLWGHALFLASKVDRRSHANVMMKFANKLSLNDPLQTLYQLMSGRTPSSVTSVQDDKWGDWRPHLAMILANTSQKPELDRKAITTLGDSLYNRGDLFAAQFCYLMAQVGFGKYSNVNQETGLMLSSSNAIRLILLGSSHRKPFKDFATNEAIMMTEIYEYACALNDDSFSIVDFQPYKFLLATRMIDYGMHVRALLYLEQISYHIQKNVNKYDTDFIGRVYTLADRLKYFDTVLDRNADNFQDDGGEYSNMSSATDQQWLQSLFQTVNQFGTLAHQPTIPVRDDGLMYPSMEIKTQIDQQFEQINQQFSELNLQYTQNYGFDQTAAASQPLSLNDYSSQQTFGQSGHVDNNNYVYDHGQHQSVDAMGADNNMMYGNEQQNLQQQQQQYDQMPNDQSDYWNQQQSNEQPDSRDNSQSPSMPSTETVEPEPDIPKPSISMPNSISNKPGFYDDPPPAASSAQTKQQNSSDEARKEQSNANKAQSQSANSNSGWFGGIWNKLSMKPKNQMILPDDKNPSIVWDPDKKKWVNTDGEAEEVEQFKPPPKMTDFATNQQSQNANPPLTQSVPHEPYTNTNPVPTNLPPAATGFDQSNPVRSMPSSNSSGGETAKVPNLQSNMFKMQRNRTLKKSYVDVFNPSGAPTKPIEPIMAPTVPVPSIPQSGYFVPGSVSAVGDGQSQQLDNSTHFYNPAQHGAGGFQ